MATSLHISWTVIVAGCLGAVSALTANLISFVMIGKINERTAANEQVSYIWWGTEVRKRFKHLYPTSKLVLLLDSCVALMLVSFVLLVRLWVFS
jgi:hypothetical protein